MGSALSYLTQSRKSDVASDSEYESCDEENFITICESNEVLPPAKPSFANQTLRKPKIYHYNTKSKSQTVIPAIDQEHVPIEESIIEDIPSCSNDQLYESSDSKSSDENSPSKNLEDKTRNEHLKGRLKPFPDPAGGDTLSLQRNVSWDIDMSQEETTEPKICKQRLMKKKKQTSLRSYPFCSIGLSRSNFPQPLGYIITEGSSVNVSGRQFANTS